MDHAFAQHVPMREDCYDMSFQDLMYCGGDLVAALEPEHGQQPLEALVGQACGCPVGYHFPQCFGIGKDSAETKSRQGNLECQSE